jgi:hypothetical protein
VGAMMHLRATAFITYGGERDCHYAGPARGVI